MGVGLTMIVVGAILALAVRDRVDWINLPVTGVILAVAGVAVIWHARRREQEHDLERQRELDIEEEATLAGQSSPDGRDHR